jgi:hypothetical protein
MGNAWLDLKVQQLLFELTQKERGGKPEMDDNFRQNLELFQQYRGWLKEGRITPEQFQTEMVKLRWADTGGVWWTIDSAKGTFLRYDGARWMPAQPPRAALQPAPVPPSRAQSVPLPQKESPTLARIRKLVAATPILALVPSVACGGLWFLYTTLGILDSEGLRGVDFITPIIVIGVPLLLWFFKKPIDRLLAPLGPTLQTIPMPLRFGIVLALPIFLGCGCATVSSSGYGSLNFVSLVSILAAAVLTRKIEVAR